MTDVKMGTSDAYVKAGKSYLNCKASLTLANGHCISTARRLSCKTGGPFREEAQPGKT